MPIKAECPLCRQPSAPEFKPFCSRACRDKDLLNWLGDAYRVPVPPSAEEEEAGGQDQP